MNSTIRSIREEDRACVLSMMREFYSSPAVFTNGSDEIFLGDIDACLSGSPYLEGYVIEGEAGICGYMMLAKSFSTEFGKPCIWLEDLYIAAPYRGLGLGRACLLYLAEKYSGALLRLEVEEENRRALALYESCGFTVLPYMEMKKG